MKPKPKRNPSDATLRNVRAANAKIAKLQQRVEALESTVGALKAIVSQVVIFKTTRRAP